MSFPPGPSYTTSYGSPVNSPHASQRVPIKDSTRNSALIQGPLLLQDFHHIDVLAHLSRERIPERLVHAKGAGAYGYFEVTTTHGSNYTSQSLFQQPAGTKVPVTARFSTVAGEAGSADTIRDVHGFAVKLKTREGIWDWVFLNTPVFFIRDPAKYPDLVHATKRNPETNLKDPDMFWDFFSQNPETIHQLMMVFSDRGTPDGFHRQHGFGGTTFKWVKVNGRESTFHYVKMHVKLSSGDVKTLTDAKATELAGKDPDYNTRELYKAIKEASTPGHPRYNRFPQWTVSIQTMTQSEAMSESYRHMAFDVTKTWPQAIFPLREIGKLVLNENPRNFFDEIEQLAFSPSHMIPYIEPSPDPLFQARLFIYPDTQRYRLGVNNKHLPCNDPNVKLNRMDFPGLSLPTVANHQRGGAGSFISQGNRPNYQSTTQSLNFTGPPNSIDSQVRTVRHETFNGTAYRDFLFPSDFSAGDFDQPRALWNLWNPAEKSALINNVKESLKNVTKDEIKLSQLTVFAAVDAKLAERIALAIGIGFTQPPIDPLILLRDNLWRIKRDLPRWEN